LLQPGELGAYEQALPLLDGFRAVVRAIVTAVRTGATADAREALLRRASPLALRLEDHLDELNRLNQAESRALLAAADGRLARTPILEAILASTLLLGILGIYWTVRRTTDVQRRELDAYVARIEASNRDLDAFAGRIAHDLRNALAPLGISASSLRHAAGRPDVVARIAEATDLRDTIVGPLDELAPLADRIDVDLQTSSLCCVPGLLHIVAVNLIGNALANPNGASPCTP
jgi:signal transduction histidine kinase